MKRGILSGVAAALTALVFCTPSSISQALPEKAASASDALTIAAGQKFILQLNTAIHTHSTRKGDRIEFVLAGDVVVDNQSAIPSQSTVRGTVTKSKRAGRLMGRAEVQLRLDDVRFAGGPAFPLHATIIRVGFDPVNAKDGQPRLKGEPGPGGNIGAVAQAGAQGALIGVLAAGGKGAMYGGAIGAGISLGGMLFKRGPDLDLPRDTMFEARFDKPLAIPLAVARRAEQVAHNAATSESRSEASSGDTPEAKTKPVLQKPVLHRTGHGQESPAETPSTQPLPGEAPAAAPPPADTPANQQPPAEAAAAQKAPVEAGQPSPGAEPPPPPNVPAKPPEPVAGADRPADSGMYKLRVDVRMVLVDTVVRDRAGRIMDNLKREDFRVYEDGKEQPVQSFSRDEFPLAVAMVVDRSGSVAPYIQELRRIAYRTLEQLKPSDQVALFSFAGNVERLVDLTTNRQRISEGLSRIRAGGGTDIIDALFDATTYLARTAPNHRRAIILISDNQATVRPQTSEGATIRMAMETETVVYSIRTMGETAPLTLRLPNLLIGAGSVSKVTQETGGEIIDAQSVSMLDPALAAVVSRLRLRYSLGYYPPNQERGGAFHAIEVRLLDRFGRPGNDYFVHARRGYYSSDLRTASQSP